jgi:uncharacterized protein (DUF486 family)
MSRPASIPRPFSWLLALLYFLSAHLLAAVLAADSTGLFRQITGVPHAHGLGIGLLEDPPFDDTARYQVLITLLVWPTFAWLYLRKRLTLAHARALAWVWLTAAVLVDFIGFMAIGHPWSLPTREFYLDCQPWITLIYAAIFASPFVSWWLMRNARAG